MNSTARLYETALRPLTDVVDAVPGESWTRPSPCAGWTARDVLGHLIGTQREFLTGHGIDLGPAPDADADPAAAWHDHAKRVAEAISDDGVVATAFDGYFGPTTVGSTFERFYVWDMVVHRWDIARSAGLDAGLSEAELDRIESGADGFGDALYLDGICRAGVDAPAYAGRETRVLARLGRRG
jgi:uncharacterized protein (TIGR03086 family)